MNTSTTGQLDFNRIFRAVRQEFRIVELKELLNQYGYGGNRIINKAQLQSRVEQLLKSDKRNQVAQSIYLISKRLNGILAKGPLPTTTDMVRLGQSSSSAFTQVRYPQTSVSRPPTFGLPVAFNPSFYDPTKVQYVPLPFYDIKEVLVHPTVLTPNCRNDVSSMCFKCTLKISRETLSKLSYREADPLPRYEIQMRMVLYETDKEQPDAFPNNVKVMVDGAIVNLPPLLNQQPQPGQARSDQQKRVSRPVNLTPYCNPNNQLPLTLTVDWQQDRHCFVFGIWVVYRVNSAILRDRLKADGPKYYEETRALIKKNLGGNSEDDCISMDSLKISLVCPLSRVKMVTPVRSKNCTHLQCFDLHNYLMMNEKRPSWKCPVCNKPCSYNVLVIDNYFAEIINQVDSNINEVELLTDGGWRVASQKSKKKAIVSNDISSSVTPPTDDNTMPVKSRNTETSNVPTTASVTPSQNAPEIITLDDSDESDDEKNASPSSLADSVKQPESRKRTYNQITALTADTRRQAQDDAIIVLSDSDDDGDLNQLSTQKSMNQSIPIGTNESTTIPLFDNEYLLDNRYDGEYETMDSSALAQISQSLLDFMQTLDTDNKNNCTA